MPGGRFAIARVYQSRNGRGSQGTARGPGRARTTLTAPSRRVGKRESRRARSRARAGGWGGGAGAQLLQAARMGERRARATPGARDHDLRAECVEERGVARGGAPVVAELQ